MKIRIESIGNVSVVFIDGNVLQENVPIFRVKLLELVEEGKVNIVLDMVASNYISSMCLATIVDVKKRLAELSGDLRLARVNNLVRNLLETTSLIKKIETYDDIESAVQSFSRQK
jgi:anti-anti-sigma factor